MTERRIVFTLGVTYQTPSDKLARIPHMIRHTVEGAESTRFDRAHFKQFGDFALVFEVVYFVLTSDFNVYMNIQQEINFRLIEHFEREGIQFAYPTQLVILAGEGKGAGE
jgi:small-conductance mechanosensitive channel